MRISCVRFMLRRPLVTSELVMVTNSCLCVVQSGHSSGASCSLHSESQSSILGIDPKSSRHTVRLRASRARGPTPIYSPHAFCVMKRPALSVESPYNLSARPGKNVRSIPVANDKTPSTVSNNFSCIWISPIHNPDVDAKLYLVEKTLLLHQCHLLRTTL